MAVCDSNGRVLAVNQAFEHQTGYGEPEVLGKSLELLNSKPNDAEFYRNLEAGLSQAGEWKGEVWHRHKSGRVFPVLQTVSVAEEGREKYYITLMLDLSRQKAAEEKLEHLAHHDPLTDLPNRYLFVDRLGQAIARNRRAGDQHVAVIFLDLDRFKDVNDTLGHPAGDELLVEVAKRLRGCLRAADTICRMGGDEFTIMLEGLDSSQALLPVLHKIREEIHKPYILQGRKIMVDVSMGVSLSPDNSNDIDELIRFADTAMFRAKASSGERFAFYSEELTREIARRFEVESELRQAVGAGQLYLVYQPQLSLVENRIIGCEVLLRWSNPRLGTIAPLEFIPIAENTGLIVPISQWVVESVSKQIADWKAAFGFSPKIAVNMSIKYLEQADVTESIQHVVEEYAIEYRDLELEITESALMQYPEQMIETLRALRENGISVAIDDFGTGYSSLDYLKHFAADILKIDRSFISGIDNDAGNQEIVRAIIALGHSLHMDVLAEGVETDAEKEWLANAGCDHIQGYLLSKPLTAEQYMELFGNS